MWLKQIQQITQFLKKKNDLEKLKKILNKKKNHICEVIIPPNKIVEPQVKFGYPIEDGFPLLSENLLKKEMIISPLKRPQNT